MAGSFVTRRLGAWGMSSSTPTRGHRDGMVRGIIKVCIYWHGPFRAVRPHLSTPHPTNRQLSSRTATFRPGSRDPSFRAIPPNHSSLRHSVTASRGRFCRPSDSVNPTALEVGSREFPLSSCARTSSVFSLKDPRETGVNRSIESLSVLVLPSYSSITISSDTSSRTEPGVRTRSAG